VSADFVTFYAEGRLAWEKTASPLYDLNPAARLSKKKSRRRTESCRSFTRPITGPRCFAPLALMPFPAALFSGWTLGQRCVYCGRACGLLIRRFAVDSGSVPVAGAFLRSVIFGAQSRGILRSDLGDRAFLPDPSHTRATTVKRNIKRAFGPGLALRQTPNICRFRT